MKVPIAGGAPVELARYQPVIESVALTASSIYWVNGGVAAGLGYGTLVETSK